MGWYVIQVPSGKELAIASDISQLAEADVLEECFVPRWETQRKFKGQWRSVVHSLIPGYVIAISSQPEKLQEVLRQISGFTKLLKSGGVVSPLNEEEVAWFQRFTQHEGRIMPLSTGVKVGDQVIVTDGPLKLYQSQIVRVDRRRSTAYVRISILGRTKEVPLGLAVLAKK